ncbi:hypothetical protein AB0M46_44955 [Dactylosporangium sp. NPDC051485]|uniref:hypothetical protein n=1 Tax=Dactylosporangium sp. NPDC051485 TaxID=3154846 RepID=UPI003431203A
MGYPDWERSRGGRERQGTETGRWDPRQERWIPQQRAPDRDDYYGVEPFPARSDPRRPGHGRVLDHDDWVEGDAEDEDEDDEPDQRSVYIGSFVATACWYLIPLAMYAGWSFTLSSQPRPGCTNAFGLACPAPRSEALSHLMSEVPEIAVAMAISIVIAMILGKVTTGWRPFAIGFASAVLGAGVATVAFAVLKTQLHA